MRVEPRALATDGGGGVNRAIFHVIIKKGQLGLWIWPGAALHKPVMRPVEGLMFRTKGVTVLEDSWRRYIEVDLFGLGS